MYFQMAFRLLPNVQSTFNTIIYMFMSKNFCQSMHRTFQKCCPSIAANCINFNTDILRLESYSKTSTTVQHVRGITLHPFSRTSSNINRFWCNTITPALHSIYTLLKYYCAIYEKLYKNDIPSHVLYKALTMLSNCNKNPTCALGEPFLQWKWFLANKGIS